MNPLKLLQHTCTLFYQSQKTYASVHVQFFRYRFKNCIVDFINFSIFEGQNAALHNIHGISKVALVIQIDGSD
jgi:hypothetical protein